MNPAEKPNTGVVDTTSTNPDEVENLKNIRNTRPGDEVTVGRETVGQGRPTTQPTKNEESLPPTAVPVDRNFERTGEFYDPMKDEALVAKKRAADNGSKKTV